MATNGPVWHVSSSFNSLSAQPFSAGECHCAARRWSINSDRRETRICASGRRLGWSRGRTVLGLRCKLSSIQLLVEPASRQQLFVGSVLGDPASVDDQDL